MSKGTVSKAIKALLDKTFLGSRLVSEIETHNDNRAINSSEK